jgi:CBS domain-containing protein
MSADDEVRSKPADDEEPVRLEGPTPEEDRLTRQTTVREAWRLVSEKPAVAPDDAGLRQVALVCAERPGVHTLAVVDSQGRLTGIIPLRLLLDELFLHVAPEEILADATVTHRVDELGRLSRAKTAGEFMLDPVYVTMDDTVKDVFVRMHDNELEGLPIVNEEMRPVGYVGQFELLQVWLRTHLRPGSGT